MRYWDFSLPSAEVRPTTISKYNTALQLALIGATTAMPLITADLNTAMTAMQYVPPTSLEDQVTNNSQIFGGHDYDMEWGIIHIHERCSQNCVAETRHEGEGDWKRREVKPIKCIIAHCTKVSRTACTVEFIYSQ